MGVGDKSCSPSLQVRRVCEEAGVAESCPVDALTCLGGERKESGRAKGMEIEQRHQHKNGEEGQERAKETRFTSFVVSASSGSSELFPRKSAVPGCPAAVGGEFGCVPPSPYYLNLSPEGPDPSPGSGKREGGASPLFPVAFLCL